MPAQDQQPRPAYRAILAGMKLAEHVAPRGFPAHDPAALLRAAKVSPPAASIQGLVELHAALRAQTELTMFGRLSVRWEFLRLLKNADAVLRAHRDTPALAAAAIPAPIFILGLPRSGTTFLHALLAEDGENLVPRNWQTIFPSPRPRDFNAARDASARKVDNQLKLFAALAPEFPDVHPITADSPQECSEITAHVFHSLRFDTIFRVPAYRGWLDATGHDNAFAFHKIFLQHLQAGQPGRWVLKCPDHIFCMDAILRTYPDARFIVVHRDPVRVFASVAHLTGILRRPFVKNVDPAEIGAQVTERWIDGAARLVDFDRREDIPPARKLHIHYHDLVANPLAMVDNIYSHFGLQTSAAAQAAMRGFLAARPRGGYGGQRRYALGEFGINPASLVPRFSDYLDYFGIAPQPAE